MKLAKITFIMASIAQLLCMMFFMLIALAECAIIDIDSPVVLDKDHNCAISLPELFGNKNGHWLEAASSYSGHMFFFANLDSDDDGLIDFDEKYAFGTNPIESDSDNDGFDDETEIQLRANPNDRASYPSWNRTFGGIKDDYGMSVQQTIDGGYIIAGATDSFGAGDFDVWLIKTDSRGKKLWDRTFGGLKEDSGRCVQQTSDGGYIIAGVTISHGVGERDIWLIKTDSNGNLLWERTFGGSGWEDVASAQQTTDGGYIIAGATDSFGEDKHAWLIKTDPNGNLLWDKAYGGYYFQSVQQTKDGGYIIAGGTVISFGAGNGDILLIKTNPNGNKLWDRIFGGLEFDYSADDYSSVQTADDGYIILGSKISSVGANRYVWLIKTDASGNKLWERTFSSGLGFEEVFSVRQTLDGGYIIVGMTDSFGAGKLDVWLIKTDAYGSEKRSLPPSGYT